MQQHSNILGSSENKTLHISTWGEGGGGGGGKCNLLCWFIYISKLCSWVSRSELHTSVLNVVCAYTYMQQERETITRLLGDQASATLTEESCHASRLPTGYTRERTRARRAANSTDHRQATLQRARVRSCSPTMLYVDSYLCTHT